LYGSGLRLGVEQIGKAQSEITGGKPGVSLKRGFSSANRLTDCVAAGWFFVALIGNLLVITLVVFLLFFAAAFLTSLFADLLFVLLVAFLALFIAAFFLRLLDKVLL